MDINEFEIISKYFTKINTDKSILVGIGDDAAIVNSNGSLAITTDTLIESIHFPKNTPAEIFGSRSLAVNLSDLASMGALPKWCTMSLSMPNISEEWIKGFSKGFFKLANQYNLSLIGGDITRGNLSATLQLIGTLNRKPFLRSGGIVSDDIYITGSVGDAAAGLSLINKKNILSDEISQFLINRFYYPSPRVDECQKISPFINSAIDISDGLLSDLGHLCEASKCGAIIKIESLPLSKEIVTTFPFNEAIDFALSGGDDYEICFSASKSNRKLLDILSKKSGIAITRIGQLVTGDQISIFHEDLPYNYKNHGYRHF